MNNWFSWTLTFMGGVLVGWSARGLWGLRAIDRMLGEARKTNAQSAQILEELEGQLATLERRFPVRGSGHITHSDTRQTR